MRPLRCEGAKRETLAPGIGFLSFCIGIPHHRKIQWLVMATVTRVGVSHPNSYALVS